MGGGISGHELLSYRIYWTAFRFLHFELVPLEEYMTAAGCTKMASDESRRRCMLHVALRELQSLSSLISAAGYTPQNRVMTGMLHSFYLAKYLGNCSGELECSRIHQALAEKREPCELLSQATEYNGDPRPSPLEGPPDVSSQLKERCERFHIGGESNAGKNPLVPAIVPTLTLCDQYPDAIRDVCIGKYRSHTLLESGPPIHESMWWAN